MIIYIVPIFAIFGIGAQSAFVPEEHLEECQCLETIEDPFLNLWVSSLEECWEYCSHMPQCFSMRFCVSC